ncbi:MAG: alpha/beta hydrolase [Marinicaulis sp.]|nr:alpha/beta hydrolase [Marinicaulis sp.]
MPLETQAMIAPDPGEWRLIIFHGTPGNRYIYGRFMRTAPRGIEVVLPARPGFGRNHLGAVTCFSEQVAAIRPFLPGGDFGDKKVVTLGVSYGGELALKAALDFPDAVAGVVTVSALIDEPHDYALTLEKIGCDPRVDEYLPNRWKKTREEVAGRRDQIGPLLDAVRDINKPVEVVHGDFDGIVPKSNSEKLMEHLGENGRLEIIPGGTHYLEGQYPRRLHRAVQRVIDRSGA